MLTLICNEQQIPTQLERHLANALLSALRKGPKMERPPAHFLTFAPKNAQMPVSPHFARARSVQARIERLEAIVQPTPSDLAKLGQARAELEEIKGLIQCGLYQQAEWPYVAGLYAVRVPELRLSVGEESYYLHPHSLHRAFDVSDNAPIWPALREVLLRRPRGPHDQPAPAYVPVKTTAGIIYGRQPNMPKSVAQWLVSEVQEKSLSTLDFVAGDYVGKKEERRQEGQALVKEKISA